MAISDRKLRAWKMRESLILDHADRMFRESGYLGLNLDHLAERIEYSKATIYNHFASKEDLVLAVSITHIERRAMLFSRALTFSGRSRERIFGIGMADLMIARLHPHAFGMLQLAQSPSIWEKTQPTLRDQFSHALGGCMRAPGEIVRQARVEGDLPDGSVSDEQILYGLVSMSKGALLLSSGPKTHTAMFGDCPDDPLDLLKANYHLFLDGVGWQPTTDSWDYNRTEQRLLAELFPEECAQLHILADA
jgi:AcrR family transcriptional regulator